MQPRGEPTLTDLEGRISQDEDRDVGRSDQRYCPRMDTNGKVAVITGGASGIGLALAERFLADGMKVVLADIDDQRLREVEARLSESGGDVAAMKCDTASDADLEALAQFALDQFGAAHVLCNNAGIGGMGDPWAGPISLWHRVIDIDLYGVVHGIRAFLPIMTEQGEGHIVNTASMAGLLAMPGASPYNAAKHAVVAISEGLYLELKATGSPVEVSVLCPSWVQTRLMVDEPTEVGNPMAAMMNQLVRDSLETEGMDPARVADQVADAIGAKQFWILTHEDLREQPVERMERAARQENPTLDLG
jgi:NAD(P)-dependent dehydrogenase (short-subunit alcohol dehydrogenase family)